MMVGSYTHISVILDRTGSMEPVRDDIIGGFNTFLEDQKQQPGLATLTLVQFDSEEPYEVLFHFAPLEDIPGLSRDTYVPRAATPLLDAIGRGINDLDQVLGGMAPEERPMHVIVVIITDGQENASREFHRKDIIKMITEHSEKDGWQFAFLSADLGAMRDAVSYGMQEASIMAYDKSTKGVRDVMRSSSDRISDLRRGTKDRLAFNQEDRARQKSEKRRGRDPDAS